MTTSNYLGSFGATVACFYFVVTPELKRDSPSSSYIGFAGRRTPPAAAPSREAAGLPFFATPQPLFFLWLAAPAWLAATGLKAALSLTACPAAPRPAAAMGGFLAASA